MDTLHEDAAGLESDDCGNHDLRQPSPNKKLNNSGATGVDDAVHELGNVLHVTLQLKEDDSGLSSILPSEDDGSSGLDDENIVVGDYCDITLDGSKATSSKPFHKCLTLPAGEFELEYENSLTRSLSLPTAEKLVSAMKGSREKEGLTPRKLSVSWAPDVYEPPPTSLSYNPKKKTITRQQIKTNKKLGKGKQKGKNARAGGSGPKDKKHYQKVGGRSDRHLDSFADTNRVRSSNTYKSSAQLLDLDDDDDDYDYDLHTSDSSCGSRFMGKNCGTMHFAYAEAS